MSRHASIFSFRPPYLSRALGCAVLLGFAACASTGSSEEAAAAPPGIDILPGVYPNQLQGTETNLEVALSAPAEQTLTGLGPLLAYASASLDADAFMLPALAPVVLRDSNGDGRPEAFASFSIAELRRLGLLGSDTTRLAVSITASNQAVLRGTDRLFEADAWLLQMPDPSGALPVGTTSLVVVDASRAGPQGGSRTIALRLWYPALPANAQPTGYFLDDREAALNALGNGLPSNVFDRLHTDSHLDAVPDTSAPRPTLLMSTGWTAPVALYSTLAQDLASHGYVVIGLSHPDGSGVVVYPDGSNSGFDPATPSTDEAVEMWAQDIGFVAEWLASADRSSPGAALPNTLWGSAPSRAVIAQVDMQRLGTFAHSLGGAAAVRAAVLSPWLRASANVDGTFRGPVLSEGPTTPVLCFLFEGHNSVEGSAVEFAERGARGAFYSAEVLGAGHNNFSDQGALVNQLAKLDAAVLPADALVGSIDTDRALAIESALLRAFFGAELSDEPSPLMSDPAAEFPEVSFVGAARD